MFRLRIIQHRNQLDRYISNTENYLWCDRLQSAFKLADANAAIEVLSVQYPESTFLLEPVTPEPGVTEQDVNELVQHKLFPG